MEQHPHPESHVHQVMVERVQKIEEEEEEEEVEKEGEEEIKLAPDAYINQSAAIAYWSAIPADVNGMLGGYAEISTVDLQGSASFLRKLRCRRPQQSFIRDEDHRHHHQLPLLARAVDCGAGIGRVTQGLLAHLFDVIDIVEPVSHFVQELQTGENLAELRRVGKIGSVWTVPLQDWTPPSDTRYDLIWNQWCLGHLTDAQLLAYLKRCVAVLRRVVEEDGSNTGWIVVKENLSTDPDGRDIFDELDSSVTRSVVSFFLKKNLFSDSQKKSYGKKKSGMNIPSLIVNLH